MTWIKRKILGRLKDALRERSTWLSVAGALAYFGVSGLADPEAEKHFANMCVAAWTLIGILMKEKPKLIESDRPWLDEREKAAYDAGVKAGLTKPKEDL